MAVKTKSESTFVQDGASTIITKVTTEHDPIPDLYNAVQEKLTKEQRVYDVVETLSNVAQTVGKDGLAMVMKSVAINNGIGNTVALVLDAAETVPQASAVLTAVVQMSSNPLGMAKAILADLQAKIPNLPIPTDVPSVPSLGTATDVLAMLKAQTPAFKAAIAVALGINVNIIDGVDLAQVPSVPSVPKAPSVPTAPEAPTADLDAGKDLGNGLDAGNGLGADKPVDTPEKDNGGIKFDGN